MNLYKVFPFLTPPKPKEPTLSEGVYVTHSEPNGIAHIRYFTNADALWAHLERLKAESIDYRIRKAA